MKHKISEGSSLFRSSTPSPLLRPHSVPGNGGDAGKSTQTEADPLRCEAAEEVSRGAEVLLPLEMQVDGEEAVFQSEVNDREGESDDEGEEYEKDDGEEEYEKDDGEEEEDEEDEAGEAAMEEEIVPVDASEGERPKLAEGFFEVEAIRRKRICKGEAQYFIKWRGWPESSNTWEPLEHLQLCPDIVEAYEQSLQSGKKTRKRKRKYTQPKKKLQYTYSSSGGKDVKKPRLGRRPSQNKTSNGPSYTPGSKQTEGDGNSNDKDNNTRKITIQLQEAAKGDRSPVNSSSKADSTEPSQGDRRIGARRRKSGSVQRFKPDPSSSDPSHTENSILVNGSFDGPDQTDAYPKIKFDFSRDSSIITRILKPIGYATSKSDDTEDVLVTFVAVRSDGKEVVIDNKFLKANYPHVLIDFYEQHLRYSPAN